MVTYNTQRMLHRKQDPQDMETFQDYRYTQAKETLAILKNYRPISILCHTYKPYKQMILNRISPVIEQRLIKEQAGFRIGKSCTIQLLNLTQHIDQRCILRRPICCLRHSEPYNPNTENLQHNSRQPTINIIVHIYIAHYSHCALTRFLKKQLYPY